VPLCACEAAEGHAPIVVDVVRPSHRTGPGRIGRLARTQRHSEGPASSLIRPDDGQQEWP
jgi:hypothetical protein